MVYFRLIQQEAKNPENQASCIGPDGPNDDVMTVETSNGPRQIYLSGCLSVLNESPARVKTESFNACPETGILPWSLLL